MRDKVECENENREWKIDGMSDEDIKKCIPVRTFKNCDEIIALLRDKDICNIQLFRELQELEGINLYAATGINFAASEYRRSE